MVAAGFAANLPFGFAGFTVIKLAGVDGTELWRQVIAGGTHSGIERLQ